MNKYLLLCGPDEEFADVAADGDTWIEEAHTEKRVRAIIDVHDGRNLGTTVFAVFREENGKKILQDNFTGEAEATLREMLENSEVRNENPLLEPEQHEPEVEGLSVELAAPTPDEGTGGDDLSDLATYGWGVDEDYHDQTARRPPGFSRGDEAPLADSS